MNLTDVDSSVYAAMLAAEIDDVADNGLKSDNLMLMLLSMLFPKKLMVLLAILNSSQVRLRKNISRWFVNV